jgi:hypothetical protein
MHFNRPLDKEVRKVTHSYAAVTTGDAVLILGCYMVYSKHSGLITFFVEEFLTSRQDIGKDAIAILEKEIANTLDMKANSRPSSSLFDKTSNGNGAETQAVSQKNAPATNTSEANAEKEVSRPPTGKEWEVINSYVVIKGEEKERQEREALRQKKMNFRKSLDDHLAVAGTLQSGTNRDDQEYVGHIMTDIEKYKTEEKQKFDRIKKKNHDEAELRMQQIQEKARRAEQDRQDALDADRRNQELNLKKQQEEQDKVARIRREKLEAQERILKENQENERLRALAKQQEADLDQRQMQEYAAKLDREASERENAFKKRMEESARNGQKFATEGAGKVQREAQLREEQLLIREQLRKEEADTAKELKKKEDQRIRTHMQLLENERQIEKKRREAAQQHNADTSFADLARREAEANAVAEKERARLRLLKQAEYKVLLDRQVEEGQRTRQKVVSMAPVEKELNMPTLREVLDDQQMLGRVMHRMRLTKASQQT